MIPTRRCRESHRLEQRAATPPRAVDGTARDTLPIQLLRDPELPRWWDIAVVRNPTRPARLTGLARRCSRQSSCISTTTTGASIEAMNAFANFWATSMFSGTSRRQGHPRGGAGESDWDLAANATELLAFTARVLDLGGSHSGLNTDLINALLTETPTRPAKRNSAWDKLVEVAASDNRRKGREALLARIAARARTRRPQAIDQTRILPRLVGFKRSWSLTAPPDEAPVEFRKLHEEVTGRLGEAIESELERLRAWQERVVSKLDVDAVPAEVVDEFVLGPWRYCSKQASLNRNDCATQSPKRPRLSDEPGTAKCARWPSYSQRAALPRMDAC